MLRGDHPGEEAGLVRTAFPIRRTGRAFLRQRPLVDGLDAGKELRLRFRLEASVGLLPRRSLAWGRDGRRIIHWHRRVPHRRWRGIAVARIGIRHRHRHLGGFRDGLDRWKFRRDDLRARRSCLRPPNREDLRPGQHPGRHATNDDPPGDYHRKEAHCSAHRAASAGNMWVVLSHLGVRPPRCSATARAAASIAMRLPTNRRGTDSMPSSQP